MTELTDDKHCGAAQNTDREIWRERPGDYYADSIHVTQEGGIGINCGGHVIVKPVREWHALAKAVPPSQGTTEEDKLVAFFRSPEGDQLGRDGDHDNLSPAGTAIRAMKELIAARSQLKAHEAVRDACFEALPECQAWGDVPGHIKELKAPRSPIEQNMMSTRNRPGACPTCGHVDFLRALEEAGEQLSPSSMVQLAQDVLRCIPADWKPNMARDYGNLGPILAEYIDDLRASAVSAIGQTGWIPASERLPKHNEVVIVGQGVARWSDPSPEYPDGKFYSITGIEWPGRPIQWEVTHWHPLPVEPTDGGTKP